MYPKYDERMDDDADDSDDENGSQKVPESVDKYWQIHVAP